MKSDELHEMGMKVKARRALTATLRQAYWQNVHIRYAASLSWITLHTIVPNAPSPSPPLDAYVAFATPSSIVILIRACHPEFIAYFSFFFLPY